jgi:hypothetical protein
MALDLKHPHPNKERAFKAEKTIRTAYRNDERILTLEDITDILTDIRHLCDHRELNLYLAMERSYEHYVAELYGRQ